MARALSTPPNGNTADTRPHRLIIRHEYKGRHLCVVHEYGGGRLEGAALEPSLKAMEASIGRLIETSHSRETGTPRQATPEQEGQSTDAKRKERNQKRRERRKNLRAKKLEEQKGAESEGTQSQAPQSERASPESSDTNLRAKKLEERKDAENEGTQSQAPPSKGPAQNHPTPFFGAMNWRSVRTRRTKTRSQAPQSERASPESSDTNANQEKEGTRKDTPKICFWQDSSEGRSSETIERTRAIEPSEEQRRLKKKKKKKREVPPDRERESGGQQRLEEAIQRLAGAFPSPKAMDSSNSLSPARDIKFEFLTPPKKPSLLHVTSNGLQVISSQEEEERIAW